MSPLLRNFILFQVLSNALNLVLSLSWVGLEVRCRACALPRPALAWTGVLRYLILSVRFRASVRWQDGRWWLRMVIRPCVVGIPVWRVESCREIPLRSRRISPGASPARAWRAAAASAFARSLLPHVQVDRLDVKARLGLHDAMATAMSAAAARAALHAGVAAASRSVRLQARPVVVVRPLFGRLRVMAVGHVQTRVRAGRVLLSAARGVLAAIGARHHASPPDGPPSGAPHRRPRYRARAHRAAA